MTSIFSWDYIERAKRQRLGHGAGGRADKPDERAACLGSGPDQGFTPSTQLNDARQTRLYKTVSKEGFEDVYWVALLCYTGLAGVTAVLWLGYPARVDLRGVGAHGQESDPLVRWAGAAALCVVLQAFVLMWFNNVPEMRAFSFYFWLLPALAYAAASAIPESDRVTQG